MNSQMLLPLNKITSSKLQLIIKLKTMNISIHNFIGIYFVSIFLHIRKKWFLHGWAVLSIQTNIINQLINQSIGMSAEGNCAGSAASPCYPCML